MKEICNISKCTGCSACFNGCAFGAIQMKEGKDGFIYPSIDESKCVDCGKCTRICPAATPIIHQIPQVAYACHAISPTEQLSSTSGGVISALCRSIVTAGGIVYGSNIDFEFTVKHIRIDNVRDLNLLKGSKYVQSEIGLCYRNVKKDLDDGRKVAFVGTPCQVAGLRKYLNKEYDSLFTIDFVCHGVPSQNILTQAVTDTFSTKPSEALLRFRYKRRDRSIGNMIKSVIKSDDSKYVSDYGLFLVDSAGGLIEGKKYPHDKYILGFLTALFYRESCYQCGYACPERVSDITCGDYYDSSLQQKLPGGKRLISMMSVNSGKGSVLLSETKKDIHLLPVDYSEIVKSHPQLKQPIKRNKYRESFLEALPTDGFSLAFHKIYGDYSRRIIKNYYLDKILNVIYKVPFTQFIHKKIKK